MADPPSATAPLLVACLCAGWCRSCDDYRAAFDALAAEFGAATRFVWVDIEDDDEVVGDVEVEEHRSFKRLPARLRTVRWTDSPQPEVLGRGASIARCDDSIDSALCLRR